MMTKNTKIIIGAFAALVLIGGCLLVVAAAVVGIGIMAAQADDGAVKNKTQTSRGRLSEKTKTSEGDLKNAETDEDETAEPAGALAPELVGKWMRSEGGSQIDSTGKTQYGGGAWHTYEFSADGSVERAMKSNVLTIMQCRIEESKSARGKAASDGETLTINFGKTRDTGTSSCAGDDNFDKTLPAETVNLKYELKTEYEETSLCIQEKQGEACYQKSKD